MPSDPIIAAGRKFLPRLRFAWVGLLLVLAAGCTGLPEGVRPVDGFEVEPYLGTWYEIARLDHSFERGLSRVTATYRRREDGGLTVINRGFDADRKEWKEARGKAYFVGRPDVGHLKVSFFGPFYGSYVIFELDPDYRYAFIAGYDKDYLWLLAREPVLSAAVRARFEERAAALGFDVDELIYVDQG